VQVISGLSFTLIYGVRSTFADGALPVPFYKEIAPTWDFLVRLYFGAFAHIFVATVAVEYLVVYVLLGRPAKAWTQLFFYIMLVNLITKPAAHLSMLFIGDPDLLGSTTRALLVDGIIELVVVTVEFGLMKWIFGSMYRRGVLQEPVTAKRTILIAAVANVASFAFGVVGLILLLIEIGR